jgi:hypothetical protein
MLLQSQRMMEMMRSGRHITVLHVEEGDTIQLHARDPMSSDSELTGGATVRLIGGQSEVLETPR